MERGAIEISGQDFEFIRYRLTLKNTGSERMTVLHTPTRAIGAVPDTSQRPSYKNASIPLEGGAIIKILPGMNWSGRQEFLGLAVSFSDTKLNPQEISHDEKIFLVPAHSKSKMINLLSTAYVVPTCQRAWLLFHRCTDFSSTIHTIDKTDCEPARKRTNFNSSEHGADFCFTYAVHKNGERHTSVDFPDMVADYEMFVSPVALMIPRQ